MTILRGNAPGRLPSQPNGLGFGKIILRGNAPVICPNEWPPYKWPGRCPFSKLYTIHPARWAGLGKQSEASPLNQSKRLRLGGPGPKQQSRISIIMLTGSY
jgi:hypothetical protein